MIFLVIPIVWGVGYSPTTIYGWVEGTDKFSIAITVSDIETGESFPAVVKTDGNLFITTISRPDDGHQLEFQIQVNYRGDSEIYEVTAEPWSLTNFNITIQETGSPTASKSTDTAQGPIITEFIRDSDEDIDDFKKEYGINLLPGEKIPQEETPSPNETRFTKESESLLVVLIMVLSLLSILIIIRERHKKTIDRKKKNG